MYECKAALDLKQDKIYKESASIREAALICQAAGSLIPWGEVNINYTIFRTKPRILVSKITKRNVNIILLGLCPKMACVCEEPIVFQNSAWGTERDNFHVCDPWSLFCINLINLIWNKANTFVVKATQSSLLVLLTFYHRVWNSKRCEKRNPYWHFNCISGNIGAILKKFPLVVDYMFESIAKLRSNFNLIWDKT